MRKVICAFNISIDGCYDHTKLSGGEEILEYFTDIMKDVDYSVTGRKMYEIFTPYWREVAKNQSGTDTANRFANTVATINQTIVSTTMQPWEGGPRIISSNPEEEVRRLKQMPGKKIAIGGMSLRAQLMGLGLIDELHLVIHPAIVGTGPKIFDEIRIPQNIDMDLVGTRIIQSNCIALHYIKR